MHSSKQLMACVRWGVRQAAHSKPVLSLLALSLFGTLIGTNSAQETSTSASNSRSENSLSKPSRGYEIAFPAMGTQVELKAFHHDEAMVQTAFDQAKQRVHELEAILTDYNPNSETRQLTANASAELVPVSASLWTVLAASDRWHKLSDGAFDASLGQLTQLWRKYRRAKRLPSSDEIEEAVARTGWRHVHLDVDNRRVKLSQADLRLDFGAIGKGFIVDQAFELLQFHGLEACLVNVSGNMRVGAAPPGRAGWRIEIAPVEEGGQPLRQIALEHAAVATSGDLWQFVLVDSVRRSHILDPKTGLGVAGPTCATVISPNATDADALATTACILGFERAQTIAQHLDNTELLVAKKIHAPVSHAEQAKPTASSDVIKQSIEIAHTPGFPEAL